MGDMDERPDRSDRQRLMPRGHWTWRDGAYATLSQGWRVGPIVWTGGQVAIDARGEVIAPGDIAAQTRAVYRAIESVLAEAGASLADVVKINSFYVIDPARPDFDDEWTRMARVRAEFFPEPGPCGTGVIVPALVYWGLVIEVEAVAVLPGGGAQLAGIAALA
jgi:enamine deaminase RidA (YjgF/YER057c/UK114 family)